MQAILLLFQRFWHSSIGKKLIAAGAGLMMMGFLLGHLAGNLLIFCGPEALNGYAKWLHDRPLLVWGARIFLLIMLALHVVATVCLSRQNHAATPYKYALDRPKTSSKASRYMIVSGSIILAFIGLHLQHFTVRLGLNAPASYLSLKGESMHDVYRMVVDGFCCIPTTLFYLVALAMLFWHLSHGLASSMQTLGLNNRRTRPLAQLVSVGISALFFVAYASIPLSVMLGFIRAH
jgi:succinate dehydrogenase / fumarate reductase, cytochrome b subunit